MGEIARILTIGFILWHLQAVEDAKMGIHD